VEAAIAILVLTVGLVAMAMLITNTLSMTTESKYLSLASMLASEKLEDLDRWDKNDPHVAIAAGNTTAGDLAADSGPVSLTVGAVTDNVVYYDQVSLGPDQGTYSEVVSGLAADGSTNYTTTSFSPGGGKPVTTTSANLPGTLSFKRRWKIELNPKVNGTTVTGVRRITVLVMSQDPAAKPPVTFQMSLVRP
ncbi:MAG: type IV pilus modification PilV family protein, partial [Candidatus Acidiferrales bacterium]